MDLFSKIKKILEKEEACVVSKNSAPLFAVIKWGKFKEMKDKLDLLDGQGKENNFDEIGRASLASSDNSFEEKLEADEEEKKDVSLENQSGDGVDINKIPV